MGAAFFLNAPRKQSRRVCDSVARAHILISYIAENVPNLLYMNTEELLELEVRLEQCVNSDDRDGFSETITRICAVLEIPTVGAPEGVDRSETERRLIEQSAKWILEAKTPEPASLCAELLFCTITPSLIFGDPGTDDAAAEFAMRLARRGTRRATLRRAFNVSTGISSNAGDTTRALEYALQSNNIAKELGDEIGVLAALNNALALLAMLGDHRLAAAFGGQLIDAFKSPLARDFLTNVRMNVATSLLALRQYELSGATAAVVCEHHQSPRTRLAHWQRLSSEVVRLRSAIALQDKYTVEACMRYIIQYCEKLESRRTAILREQAILFAPRL